MTTLMDIMITDNDTIMDSPEGGGKPGFLGRHSTATVFSVTRGFSAHRWRPSSELIQTTLLRREEGRGGEERGGEGH